MAKNKNVSTKTPARPSRPGRPNRPTGVIKKKTVTKNGKWVCQRVARNHKNKAVSDHVGRFYDWLFFRGHGF